MYHVIFLQRHGHEMSLAMSPFGGMGFGGRMGMGLMPFGGPSPFSMMNGMMANMDNMMRSMVSSIWVDIWGRQNVPFMDMFISIF